MGTYWIGIAVIALVVAVLGLTLPTENADGTCVGLGWGCKLSPRDTVALLALLGAVAWVPAVVLCSLLPLLFATRTTLSGVKMGLLSLGMMLAVCVVGFGALLIVN